MARYTIVRKRHHPVRNVLVVLLVALLVYIGCAVFSLCHAYEDVQAATTAYQQMEQQLSSGDLRSLTSSTDSLATAVSNLDGETSSWVWAVASYVPWIGEDVSVARGLASVGDDLCANALQPAVREYAALSSGSASAADAASTLQGAATTVSDCDQRLAVLGTSHFSQLNEAKDRLSRATSALDGTLGSVSSLVSALSGLL